MTVTLLIPNRKIILAEEEKFVKVRKRLNEAKQMVLDFELGKIEGKDYTPYHLLTFKTSKGGRITLDVRDVIHATSDEPKDS